MQNRENGGWKREGRRRCTAMLRISLLSLLVGGKRTSSRLTRDEVVRAEEVAVGGALDGIESSGL